MRLNSTVATLSLGLLAAACSKPESPVAAKEAARDASHETALTRAPQSYQRMRFVSPAEQSNGGQPMQPTKASSHAAHQTPMKTTVAVAATPTPSPLAELEAPVPAPVVTVSNSTEGAPEIVVAAQPAPVESGPAPWEYENPMEHRRGAVVIRGGNVGADKCDPLTDGRARRGSISAGAGSMRMPAMSSGTFARGGRN